MKQDNYSTEEAQRWAVAAYMLKFAARTRTIRLATRLSDDQIRRLFHRSDLAVTTGRHRGRSPTSATQYTRNHAMQLQASIFASVLITHGLFQGAQPKLWLRDGVQYAQRFCEAYEAYLQMGDRHALSFERAWYFARNLAARRQLYLQRCQRCTSHFVRDTSTVLKHQCPLCQAREHALNMPANSLRGGEV